MRAGVNPTNFADGVVAIEATEARLVPTSFVAVTVNE